MTEKRLLASLFFLFAVSAAFLFYVNERGLDPDQGKDWWSLSFTAPREDRSFVFTIANHTQNTTFQYTIDHNGDLLTEGILSVGAGQSIDYDPRLSKVTTGRITITVSHDGRDEHIYRSL